MSLILLVPVVASAGLGHRRGGHCGRCAQPFSGCGCAQPVCNGCNLAPASCGCQQPVIQTQIIPQTTTMYRQEQFTTLQPVTRTEIRREAHTVNVPVTTCRQVVVDEGTYQTVWVPKLTTKTVSEQTIQKQVRFQDVPYQVVQQVPVVQTRVVPQQVTTFAPVSTLTAQSTCHHSHAWGHQHSHSHTMVSQPVTLGRPQFGNLTASPAATASLAPMPEPYSSIARQPVQQHAHAGDSAATNSASTSMDSSSASNSEGTWSKVPARKSSDANVQLQKYEVQASQDPALQPFRPTPSSTPAFSTAAGIWRAQGAFSRN